MPDGGLDLSGRRRAKSLRIALLAAALVAAGALFSWPGVTAPAVDAAGPAAEAGPAQATGSQSPAADPSPSASATPTWRLDSYRSIGGDKSFKADLIEELPSPPELVVFGGSRAMRFEPSFARDLTGLTAFNCAAQCFRPEDAWAFSSYLIARSPETDLHCVIALQARTFRADQMRAGLLYDERLSTAFPSDLIAEQRATLPSPPVKEVLGRNRYSARGCLLHNAYDDNRERPGFSFRRQIDVSIGRLQDNHRWDGPMTAARPHSYFEATMRLYNERGVKPLIILMPVQPRALAAFRKVGFQRNVDDLRAYLRDAQARGDFRVLNLTDIGTFGGKPGAFYDAVHPTVVNARLILKHAAAVAPECFR